MKIFFVDYIPPTPFNLPTLLGTSISLILAFNINQSYDRWWEARKVWGAIVNDSRSLIIQLKAFISDAALYQQEMDIVLKRMAYRQIAWCYSLGQSLRNQDPLHNLKKYISVEDFNLIQNQNNKPYALLNLHMMDLKLLLQEKSINSFQQIQLDNTIVRLCDSMGKAERINNTVFPVTYILYVHFFIYLFLVIFILCPGRYYGFF